MERGTSADCFSSDFAPWAKTRTTPLEKRIFELGTSRRGFGSVPRSARVISSVHWSRTCVRVFHNSIFFWCIFFRNQGEKKSSLIRQNFCHDRHTAPGVGSSLTAVRQGVETFAEELAVLLLNSEIACIPTLLIGSQPRFSLTGPQPPRLLP